MSATSSTIVNLPDQKTATLPKRNYLNNEDGLLSWLLTGDHKRIAILYLISITFFFFIGGAFAGLIRLELLTPQPDLVASDTYNKFFSMHGIIMVFLFLVPSVPATLGNFLMPIMIGAKDLAFPKVNLLSWYLYWVGGLFTLAALVLGGVDTGWTFTTPLSTHYLNTHVITAAVGIFIIGFSSIFTGLNFIVTVHKMRAPGLTWFRLPLFVWTHYATSIILVLATPVLTATLILIGLERLFHIGIFDPKLGGDPLLFQHLFWFYSHPAVWNEIGFGGPAYPRGYKALGIDKREPYEVEDARPHDDPLRRPGPDREAHNSARHTTGQGGRAPAAARGRPSPSCPTGAACGSATGDSRAGATPSTWTRIPRDGPPPR